MSGDDATFVFEYKESISGGKTPSAAGAVTPPPMPKLSPAAPGGSPWSQPVNPGPAQQAAAPPTKPGSAGEAAGKKPKEKKPEGSLFEKFVAGALTKGLGKSAGAAVGELAGGLIGSVVPIVGTIIGTAIGQVIGTMFGKTIDMVLGAFGRIGKAADNAAEKIRPFSAALQGAEANISVNNTLRNMSRGGRMGGVIANYETAKNDVGYQLQRLGDVFLKPMLAGLTGVLRLVEIFVHPLVAFLEWFTEEFYGLIATGFNALNKVMGGIPGFLGGWFKRLWDKLFPPTQEADAWSQFWGLAR